MHMAGNFVRLCVGIVWRVESVYVLANMLVSGCGMVWEDRVLESAYIELRAR